jgi:hypothetical protein
MRHAPGYRLKGNWKGIKIGNQIRASTHQADSCQEELWAHDLMRGISVNSTGVHSVKPCLAARLGTLRVQCHCGRDVASGQAHKHRAHSVPYHIPAATSPWLCTLVAYA